MPLFDFTRQRRDAPPRAMKQTPYVPIDEQQAPRQRRGLFGGLTRRDDGDPGTFLNYFLFGRNGVQDMRDSRMQRDLFNFNMEGAKRERDQEAQQQQALDEAIGTLEPSMQPWARIAPEAAAQRAFAPPEAPDWMTDPVTGQIFRITPDGRRVDGQGRVGVRPIGGAGGSSPPLAERQFAASESLFQTQDTLDLLDRLGGHGFGEFGPIGAVSGFNSASRAGQLRNDVDTLRSRLSVDAIRQLRAQGISLGPMTEAEWQMLANEVAVLNPDGDERVFERQITSIRARYVRLMNHIQDEYQRNYGALPQGIQRPDAGGSGGNDIPVIELD